ncbi:MAG TPA: tripartite tricarboxylate transporter substrate binding protein [Xanthobacteraceae bacterium]|nr:tripartite tricarboxylate transporter substrate binding protein [Xanthobacteraceae bacterium]
MRGFLCLTFGAALALFAAIGEHAVAQSGPSVRIIVPFPPGGTADILARLLSQQIGQSAQQNIIVENRPGAGASIGYEFTARAEPDGNTVVVAANSVVINPLLRKVNFDPVKSFAPICNLVTSPLVFVVNTASSYKTIADLIGAAQAKPGTITVAALGPATAQHIAFESFKRATATNMIFVAYAGGAPAMNALLGQQVDAALVNYSEAVEQIKAGKLRALATASAHRLKPAPEVPTVAESGYPGYSAEVWLGLLAPAATPASKITQLTDWFSAAMASPDVDAKLESIGLYPAVRCGEDFAHFINVQAADYTRIIADANIKVE